MKLKTKLLIAGVLLMVIFLTQCSTSVYNESVSLYNTSVNLKSQYVKKTRQQVSTYDANYLAFIEKTKLANINKDVFITVTDIIMKNRKDGESVAWKWVQENQNIPYEEFTSFYRELSSFVTAQYQTLSNIEQEKQDIAATHNILLKTYPNNLYNWWLKIEPLDYQFGYISDSTRKMFLK